MNTIFLYSCGICSPLFGIKCHTLFKIQLLDIYFKESSRIIVLLTDQDMLLCGESLTDREPARTESFWRAYQSHVFHGRVPVVV